MERLTLHNLTSAFDYAKNNISQEEAAKITAEVQAEARLKELQENL